MRNFYQNTDRLIRGIRSITENRCSLSDDDVKLLQECIVELEKLKSKRKSSPHVIQRSTLRIVELLLRFFVENDTLQNWFDTLK